MRIRTIKPEFWTDEQMSMRSDFSRLLAIALLNYSDDDGYFLANPILIRGACFPFLDDSKKIPRSIQELSDIGFLEIGLLDDGRQVGRIVNFRKHQRIDKPQLSKLKEKSQFQESSKNDLRTFQEPSKIVLGGNGKGMEGEKEQGRGRLPPTLSDVIEFCKSKGYLLFDCERYYDLRTKNNWINANNRKIVNWKNDINTADSFGTYNRKKTFDELQDEEMHRVANEIMRSV